MATLENYKSRWEDFRIDCANLDHSRRALFHGFGNEDVGATEDELLERVERFEARFAHLSVFERAERLRDEAYRYADI